MGFKPLILGIALLFAARSFSVNGQTLNDRDERLDSVAWDLPPAIVRVQAGCAAISLDMVRYGYRFVCSDMELSIWPRRDGIYRITLYTGFPPDTGPDTTHPTNRQDYEWSGYRDVYVDGDGCLRPTPYKGLYWSNPLGACPPSPYPAAEPDIQNPYKENAERWEKTWDRIRKELNYMNPFNNKKSMLDPGVGNGAIDPTWTANSDIGGDIQPPTPEDLSTVHAAPTTLDFDFSRPEDAAFTIERRLKQRRGRIQAIGDLGEGLR